MLLSSAVRSRPSSRAGALAHALTAAAVTALVGPAATASPLEDPWIGGILFTGPAHEHPSAVYINPAMLGRDTGHHLFLAGTLRLDRVEIDRAAIDPATGVAVSGAGDAAAASHLSPGWMFAGSTDFAQDRFTVGVGIYVPVAETFPGGEEALRYHSLGGHHYAQFWTLSLAIRAHDRAYFGASLSGATSRLSLGFARDTALEGGSAGLQSECGGEPCGAENPQATQRYDVSVSRPLSVGFQLGAAVEVAAGWWLGLGWLVPPGSLGGLDVPMDGDVRVDRAPRAGGGTVEADARVVVRLPQSVYVGLQGRIAPRWNLVGGARWTDLSRHELLDLRMFGAGVAASDIPEWYPRRRGLQDNLMLEGGIEGVARQRLRPGVRVRLETSGVSDQSLSAAQVGGLNLSLAGGLEWRPLDGGFALALGYAFTWFPERTADPQGFDPAARVACVDSMFDLETCIPAREGRALPTAAGDYRHLRHAWSLSVRYDWF